MKKQILLLFSFLLISFSLKSQADFKSGFIVDLKGDTIYGLVDYRGDTKSSKICSFKKNESSEREEYTPLQINGYGFDGGKNYISILVEKKTDITDIESKQVFLEYLVKGYISLFFYRDDFDHYYIISPKDGLNELVIEENIKVDEFNNEFKVVSNKYLGVLSFYLQDCDSIKKLIPKTDLEIYDLSKLIKIYNDCICYECISFVKPKPFTKSSFGFAIGSNKSVLVPNFDEFFINNFDKYNFEYLDNILNSELSYNVSVYYNLVLPRLNEKISIQTELMIASNRYTNHTLNSGVTTDLQFDAFSLKFPITLKYTYSAYKIKPFIYGGIVFNKYYFKNSSITQVYYLTNNVENRQEVTDFLSNQNMNTGILGTGFLLKLTKNIHLIFDFKYELGKNVFYGKSSNFYLSTGLNFL
jgi:hypothetical protein